MIVDSSALLAIVFKEPGFEGLVTKVADASHAGMGAPTLAESAIVLSARCGFDARPILARLIQELAIATIAFGEPHWRAAADAYDRYGRGRHAAGLNFGDCLTYATAKLSAQPLLFVGEDFARTDLEAA